ncbi:hypothetical protein ACIOHB_36350 [Streptomyces microflavus]|uniref:hypothetical protein n=1 Tax=Streptomyces microflavus TaxID=1919 RepID=UPI00382F0BEF
MQGWKKTALLAASCVLIVAMVVVWFWVDLGTADGIASVIGASAGVAGLAYALISSNGTQQTGPTLTVSKTGKATATGGGTANTGITMLGAGQQVQARTDETGDAESDGSGDANSGIRLT